jgi:glycosyltransferase involved in cell wall biosynthesis
MNKKLSPLVSVITAVYNQENFLKETIECVINQTFRDWEYILVDDGSSDKSGQIAKEYAKNHPGKIIYLEHEKPR